MTVFKFCFNLVSLISQFYPFGKHMVIHKLSDLLLYFQPVLCEHYLQLIIPFLDGYELQKNTISSTIFSGLAEYHYSQGFATEVFKICSCFLLLYSWFVRPKLFKPKCLQQQIGTYTDLGFRESLNGCYFQYAFSLCEKKFSRLPYCHRLLFATAIIFQYKKITERNVSDNIDKS